MFLFASSNRYDPEEAFQCVCTTHFADRTQYRGRKRIMLSKIELTMSKTQNNSRRVSLILPSKHERNVKNGHQLTLFALECD